MGLIDDDGVVLLKVSVTLHRVEQDAVGHHFDFGVGANSVGEPHLITN